MTTPTISDAALKTAPKSFLDGLPNPMGYGIKQREDPPCRKCGRPLAADATTDLCHGCDMAEKIAGLLSAWEDRLDYDLRGATFDRIAGEPGVASVIKWAAALGQPGETRGLYMWGKSGNGKSVTAAALGYHIIRTHLFKVRWVNAVELIMECEDCRAGGQQKRMTVLEPYIAAPILILDDLGYGSTSESAKMAIYVLLNRRSTRRARTIITSNYDLAALCANYGAQIADRVTRSGPVVQFQGSTHNPVKRL